MRIGYVGLGKLGLPVALAVESKGHEVFGYDISPKVKEILEAKVLPYQEKGAQELLNNTNIQFTSLYDVIKNSEIIFVPIQTPHDPKYEGVTPLPDERVDFDYFYLKSGIKEISKVLDELDEDRIIVIISTVLPTTIEREIKPLLSKHAKLCYNPYFIAMGTTIPDFLYPEFVLLGVDDELAASKVRSFYQTLGHMRVYECTIREAEMIKVTYNTYITMKTVFGNNVMEMCHKLGADCDKVIDALNLANRRIVNTSYMYGGMGDAGGCHPRDNIALSHYARKFELSVDLYEWLMKAREHQTNWLIDLIEKYRQGLPVIILGKSYKPETNLTVGSASILMSNLMKIRGIEHEHYDHKSDPNDEIIIQSKLHNPACFFIGTKHDDFKNLKFPKGSVVVDPFRYIPDSDGVQVERIGQFK